MLAVYYNLSTNTNPSHPENHNRVITSINYLNENLPTTTIYNNNQILDYLQENLQLGSKQEIIEGYEHFIQTNIVPIQQHLITQFEKLCFLKYKAPTKIEIIQNELFVDKNITTITTDGSSTIS